MTVQVEFFEPFWDSGEARVGETGARGWKLWMLQQERGGWVQPSEGEPHPSDFYVIEIPLSFTDLGVVITKKLTIYLCVRRGRRRGGRRREGGGERLQSATTHNLVGCGVVSGGSSLAALEA